MTERSAGFRVRQILAFAVVYVVWGSTYLAIRFAIETLPGNLMAGVRFLIAGGILYAYARLTGSGPATWIHWRSAAIIGALLFVGGNGGVVWAEQYVASGLASLLVATEPLMVALLLWFGGTRPSKWASAGLLLGFFGASLLAMPGSLLGESGLYLPGVGALLFASLSWAIGSLYARRAELPTSPALTSSLQMLCGGVFLTLISLVLGEWGSFEPSQTSLKSWLALAYLIVFGALVAFSAYSWLLRTTEPTLVATYAYVNPVVAVFLGWLLAGEPVGPRTMVAAVLIIVSVFLLSRGSRIDPEAEDQGI